MNLGYWWRLAAFSLAVCWLAQAALGGVVAVLAPAALRAAGRMRAGAAARLLFALRMVPAAGAAAVVAGLAAPSYLFLETHRGPERMGWLCLIAAFLSAAGWGRSLLCGLTAVAASRRFLAAARPLPARLRVGRSDVVVWTVEEWPGLVALAGLVRPRVLLSRELAECLPEKQIAAVLRHEQAHGAARDNWKRLCLRVAHGGFPFRRRFAALEQGWARQAEWAADDCAAAGDRERALSLAEALLRVARTGGAPRGPALAAPLVEATSGIAERVERLLAGPNPEAASHAVENGATAAAVVVAATLALLAWRPGSMAAIHRWMEHLAR